MWLPILNKSLVKITIDICRHNTLQGISSLPRTGRSKVTTAAQDKALIEAALAAPMTSVRELRRQQRKLARNGKFEVLRKFKRYV